MFSFRHFIRLKCSQLLTRQFTECAGKTGLVLGVQTTKEEPNRLSEIAKKFDEANNRALCRHLESVVGGPLGLGEYSYLTNVDPAFSNICLVGMGGNALEYNKQEELDERRENARIAAGVGAMVLRDTCVDAIAFEPFGCPEAAGEGAQLGVWQYLQYRSKRVVKTPTVQLYESTQTDDWDKGLTLGECQNVARQLSEAMRENEMTPNIFSETAAEILCKYGVEIEIRDKDWAESKQLGAFLAVARGSSEPPVLLEINYTGGLNSDSPVLLVGKGTTFNTGGICLWDNQNLEEMRGDMSGAAVVVAVIKALAMLNVPLNVRAVIPLCENMPSGSALKPGDVVQSLAGKCILIEDTGREGVLSLADALTYGQRAYKPKLVLDVATLTPGVRDCIGSGASAVFTNDDDLWTELLKAGSVTGDRLWRLPLWKHFTDKITHDPTTDLSNVGYGSGGSPCLAAAFLNEFIESVDWAHMDTWGTGMLSTGDEIPYLERGRMTGRPTRTIYQLLYQITCPTSSPKSKKSC